MYDGSGADGLDWINQREVPDTLEMIKTVRVGFLNLFVGPFARWISLEPGLSSRVLWVWHSGPNANIKYTWSESFSWKKKMDRNLQGPRILYKTDCWSCVYNQGMSISSGLVELCFYLHFLHVWRFLNPCDLCGAVVGPLRGAEKWA